MTEVHFAVLIVGAGLSGVGAACHLERQCPEKSYTILEARDAIGGTWDLFRYPGIRSDMHQLILDIWRDTKINIFMITHDLQEGFYLGTRLWVFDKIRHDPQPNAYGATITYDIPVSKCDTSTYKEIDKSLEPSRKQLLV